jgi:hypothetical protein
MTTRTFVGSNATVMAEQTLFLLGALEILSTTDIFVGSYNSNIGRLASSDPQPNCQARVKPYINSGDDH